MRTEMRAQIQGGFTNTGNVVHSQAEATREAIRADGEVTRQVVIQVGCFYFLTKLLGITENLVRWPPAQQVRGILL